MFLITHTRSVDPSPQKKKKWGGGCDSGGAPSGVPPFPPPQKKKKKKKRTPPQKKKEKKERGGGLDAPFVWLSPGWHSTAIVLIPLWLFSTTHVNCIPSHTSHFPAPGKKKEKERDEDIYEWCSMRLTTHMNASTRNPLVVTL